MATAVHFVCLCVTCESTHLDAIALRFHYPALHYPEPRLSGLAVFFLNNSENGRVPQMRMRVAAVTMETSCLSSAHAQTTTAVHQ